MNPPRLTMSRPTRRSDVPGRPVRRPRGARGPWQFGPIPVIGLVGGIGAGKSLAAAALAARGAFVIDADTVGHALLEQPPARQRILKRFGEEILGPEPGDGSPRPIDRRALGAIVFDDPSARRDLERILHPRMRRTFERAIARTVRKGRHTAVVLDAAVLFEAGWDDLCDVVFFVDAPRELRLRRLAAARGWTAEALAAREAAQHPLDEKKARADAVLPNTGPPEDLAAAVDRAWVRHIGRLRPVRD